MAVTMTIDIKDEALRKLIDTLQRRLTDNARLLRSIGEAVVEGVKSSFDRQRSPEGRPWKPSLRAKREGGETLRMHNTLFDSIHPEVYADRVVVGTPVKYAAVHQFGARKGSFGVFEAHVKAHTRRSRKGEPYTVRAHTRKQALPWGDIPARPFMGVSDDTLDEIRETIRRHLVAGLL